MSQRRKDTEKMQEELATDSHRCAPMKAKRIALSSVFVRAHLWLIRLSLCLCVSVAHSSLAAAAGTRAHFAVLTSDWERAAPFASVDLTYGPSVDVGGRALIWWQVDARAGEDEKAAPLFSVRCLTERDPLATPDGALNVVRYALRPSATGPA